MLSHFIEEEIVAQEGAVIVPDCMYCDVSSNGTLRG